VAKGTDRSPLHFRRIGASATVLLAVLALGTSGCATKTVPEPIDGDLQAELARLHAEHQALQAEIAALRGELGLSETTVQVAPPTEAPAPAPTAAEAPLPVAEIDAVLDLYRQAFEAEDMGRIRSEVYGSDLPADDLRYLEIWFERTDGLQIEMDPRNILVHNGTADAVIEQTMTYRLTRTSEQKTVRLTIRMVFERRGSEWRVTSARMSL
jgi:hypothetical protein